MKIKWKHSDEICESEREEYAPILGCMVYEFSDGIVLTENFINRWIEKGMIEKIEDTDEHQESNQTG